VTLRCPLCDFNVDTSELQLLPGTGGGLKCPGCGQVLMFRQSRRVLRWTISVLVSAALVWIVGIRSPLIFAGLAFVLWIPISLLVNAYFVHPASLTLVPWKPRRHRKTPVEFMNDRNATIKLFGKTPK